MEQKFKITIPEPCHENWHKMTPKDNGRFCLSCSKTVIDFSNMLPEEVQHFFIQNRNKKICGRFKNEQLESLIIQIPSQVLYSQTNYHKIFLLALFIAMGTTLFSCQDKEGNKQKIDKVEIVDDNSTAKNMTTGGPMAVKKKDCTQNPPPPLPPPKKDTQIPYSSMVTGEIVPIDPMDDPVNETTDYDAIFNTASLDFLPEQEMGIKKYFAFINNNFVVPNKSEKQPKKIYVSFVIEKDGSLSTFKILHEIGTGTGEEAIRVLKLAPKWIPGKLNNRVVRTSYSLPIIIKNE